MNDEPRWYERGLVPPYLHYWPHFVAGIPANWIARHIVCPIRGHAWRQTWEGFGATGRLAGRQCRRCWLAEWCPCLKCNDREEADA